ncbi:type II toxin-antitoxin system RelE/ParE family toxin [Edaphobacter paludis]|uniref:Type II toxin-antitoxin system RelE/ParE family toxin n=1 Tax=Edaphobacter paludis TaxID=3035702 RepID=A0AAU7D5L3_9BACT
MAYDVSVTEIFKDWYEELSMEEQASVEYVVDLLIEAGPALAHPHSSGINASKFSHMRELRIQHKGRPYRVLYAFDPTRSALLILGGDKTGDDRWYDKMVPKADKLYEDHLKELKQQ